MIIERSNGMKELFQNQMICNHNSWHEIGSEFWDVQTVEKQNYVLPESTQWFLSGRSALQAIIKEMKDYHTVAMPSWCCDSMVKPFVDAGLEVRFYPVYFDGSFVQEISWDSDVLFLMDYFGYSALISDVSSYKGVVIRDMTHSLFSSTYTDANYYFGSLRKWCGVWTGGYAWVKDGHKLTMENTSDYGYVEYRKQAMQRKSEYISGLRADKKYLKIFDEAEEALDRVGIAPADSRDVDLAKKLNVEEIRARRRLNAGVLRSAFPDWLIFPDMSDSDCPMFVPVLVPDGRRDELRRFLINNEIYCPIHWPVSKYHKLDERAETIYKNTLSLVCDQRYTEEDMYRMVETIKAFMEV